MVLYTASFSHIISSRQTSKSTPRTIKRRLCSAVEKNAKSSLDKAQIDPGQSDGRGVHNDQ